MRLIVLAALLAAPAAHADVRISEGGFVAENKAVIAAPPSAVWAALIKPSGYWNPEHSYSGDARNFSLEAKAGGCFCETFGEGGSIEHMHVVLVWPEKTLRLSGGLGPLQGEGVVGTLTWELKPAGTGTEVTQTYIVGGHMRLDGAETPPLVGQVIGEQLARMKRLVETGNPALVK